MRIEIDFHRDPVAASAFCEASPPAGVTVEPFVVPMSNEPGFTFPAVLTVALVFGGKVLAPVISHFLIEFIEDIRRKRGAKDHDVPPTIRVEGFRVGCEEQAITRKIEEIRKE